MPSRILSWPPDPSQETIEAMAQAIAKTAEQHHASVQMVHVVIPGRLESNIKDIDDLWNLKSWVVPSEHRIVLKIEAPTDDAADAVVDAAVAAGLHQDPTLLPAPAYKD
jgi:hypothetical protein